MSELEKYINEIATYLSEGEIWHRKVANELRKLPNKRGFARMHEAESKYDQKEHLKYDKLIRDNLKYAPVVDMNYVSKAESYSIVDLNGFKQHFKTWYSRENAFLQSINSAIKIASGEDMELYHCLCCLAKEVKNESTRSQWIYDGLEDTGWNGHDIRIVSYLLHNYFEKEYDGGIIDWNIG